MKLRKQLYKKNRGIITKGTGNWSDGNKEYRNNTETKSRGVK